MRRRTLILLLAACSKAPPTPAELDAAYWTAVQGATRAAVNDKIEIIRDAAGAIRLHGNADYCRETARPIRFITQQPPPGQLVTCTNAIDELIWRLTENGGKMVYDEPTTTKIERR